MRLLVISGHFPPLRSPEAAHTLRLCEQMSGRGVDVRLLTTRRDPQAPDEYAFRVHPVVRDWSWRSLPRLAWCLRRHSPDAVLLLYLGGLYDSEHMITFAPTLCHRVSPATRFVTQFENIGGASLVGLRQRIGHRVAARAVGPVGVSRHFGTLLRDSDHIIAMCEDHLSRLEHLHAGVAQKASVVSAPCLLPADRRGQEDARHRVRQELGLEDDAFVISYLGYMYPGKGIETLLAAFRSLCHGPRVSRLLMIGSDPDIRSGSAPTFSQEMQRLANAYGIGKQVTWTGHCGDEDVSAYLSAADVCALPFDSGVRLNNSSFAAAATHGLPILTTCSRAPESALRHCENVFLCAPKDPVGMAEALRTLSEDAGLRRGLSHGARRMAAEWFSWPGVLDRTLAALGKPPAAVGGGVS